MGFRKFYIKPIFSRCINGTDKTKFTRKINKTMNPNFIVHFIITITSLQLHFQFIE